MNVGIITFHNGSNYGAALQTYALQKALVKYTKNVYIINYQNRFIMKGLDVIRLEKSLHGIYYFLIDILYFRRNKVKIKNFKEFFRFYNLSMPYSRDFLKNKIVPYDVVVCGSDQIWNPRLTGGYDEIYFGKLNGVKSVISYASSMGNYKFDDISLNMQLSDLLSHIEKISVREKSKEIKSIVESEVIELCDPTLLLTFEEWKNGLGLKEKHEKYLLVYCMTDSRKVIEYAKRIGKKRALKVYYIGNSIFKHIGVKYIYDIGPKEFVELFYNASYVVTNSFHGTAFSANFGKQFTSLINSKSPERARILLEKIGLIDRLVDYDHILDDISSEEIKYAQGKLNNIRLEGNNYLHDYFQNNICESDIILYDENKYNCCGCSACCSVCPQGAITMVSDDEGFLYPQIIASKCIHCMKCINICSFKKKQSEKGFL